MDKKLHLHIATPVTTAFDGKVDSIVAPGTEGYLGILPGHTYLFTSLCDGDLTIRVGEDERVFNIGSGYMEVHPSGAIIITEKAEEG
ncbi:MAG: F0F1 ATP synthase subunit epsilon [bacterium]|nr:F0F1 ATP synthase subunit epsilon [bacterium]